MQNQDKQITITVIDNASKPLAELAERIEQYDHDNVQPEAADLPHREWICETCNAVNSHLDAECQFCDPVSLAAVRIAASLGDGYHGYATGGAGTSQASTR